jgi:tetratricopeptide (TPR) repeat protein
MNPTADTFARALQHRRSRDLPQAERLFRQVVQANASHTEAWRDLGLTCLELGKLADAEESLRQATRLAPLNAATHSDLGCALAQQNKLDLAEQSFREALRLEPDMPAGHNNLGLLLIWQGRLDESVIALRRAIELSPAFADAHNNLGLALAARGQVLDGVDCYREALRINPQHADAQTNLNRALGQPVRLSPVPLLSPAPPSPAPSSADRQAAAYNEQGIQCFLKGRLEEAVAAFRQALRVQPNNTDAHTFMGNIFYYQGRHNEAIASYRRALELEPTRGIFHSNVGNVLVSQGRFREAEALCREAVRLQPAESVPHNVLGNALRGMGKLDEAADSYREALRIEPLPVAHYNLGVVMADQNRYTEAIESYREAIRLKPDYADAMAAHADALLELQRIDEGIAAAQQAIRLQPNYPMAVWLLGKGHLAKEEIREALSCFEEAARLEPKYVADVRWAQGTALLTENRASEAVTAFDAALRLNPNHLTSRFGRAIAYLVLGDLGTGFREYEWRKKIKGFLPRALPGPMWDGSPLGGRTILLHWEQGLGDTIHFVRYASEVKKKGGTVIVECQPALKRLLARTAGIDRLIASDSPLPAYDVCASLLSLPSILGTTSATIPADIPYLTPDDRLVEQWRQEVNTVPGFRVGISWQGSPEHKRDRFRSIPLREFAPLARVDGVQLVSLQWGLGSEQVPALAGRFTVIDWTDRLSDFADTAALLKSLDLIITSDTANAHLAGALGVPVWVAMPFYADWRWQLNREDSPWYPTMRLFRPRERAGWGEVFQRVADELQKLVRSRR